MAGKETPYGTISRPCGTAPVPRTAPCTRHGWPHLRTAPPSTHGHPSLNVSTCRCLTRDFSGNGGQEPGRTRITNSSGNIHRDAGANATNLSMPCGILPSILPSSHCAYTNSYLSYDYSITIYFRCAAADYCDTVPACLTTYFPTVPRHASAYRILLTYTHTAISVPVPAAP